MEERIVKDLRANRKRPGRPKKRRLFEPLKKPDLVVDDDLRSRKQHDTPAAQGLVDRPIAGILDIKGDMKLFIETLERLELSEKDLKTTFWDALNANKSEKKVLQRKSPEQLRDVNLFLDKIEDILVSGANPSHKSQLNFASNIFKPTSLASRIFVDNARSILTDLSNNGARIKEVSERYGVREKSLRDSMRYYLFRSGPQVEARTKKLKLSIKNEQTLTEDLETYLCSRRGQYTNLKMMVDHLKGNFKGAPWNHELSPASNFINRARVARILKEKLRYTWRKNWLRDPRADNPELVEMRKVFPELLKKLGGLGYNLIYIDESAISPTTISAWSWQKKGELAPLLRDPWTRINVIAARVFRGKYAFMLKKGPTKSEHVIRFLELLDLRMKEFFGEEYRRHTILVMDNAKVHTSLTTRSYMRQKGFEVLMLPPYSPELNKAEHIFRSLKGKLRRECLYERRLEWVVAQIITNM